MKIFDSVSSSRPLASQFDLSHTRKFSMQPGKLYPILMQEALPSDVWKYDANTLVRMAPMIAPIMHMVDVCAHGFFLPRRLCQMRGKWEIFITGGKNGDGKDANGVTVEAPYFIVSGTVASGATQINIPEFLGPRSLGDFLGFQYSEDALLAGDLIRIDASPFIAFWRMYNDYFRNPNLDLDLVDEFPEIFEAAGGDLTAAIWNAINNGINPFPFFTIPRVRWEKDYFTSALPFAQRGEAVEAPLTGTGTVTYKPESYAVKDGGLNPAPAGDINAAAMIPGDEATIYNSSNEPIRIENIDSVSLTAGGFTITALRTAARLQEWLEKMAVGGSRYIEQIKQIFGVTSSDARLQRTEYLGGGKLPVHISEVIQNSSDSVPLQQPIGQMAGHGVTAGSPVGFKKFCEEHGYFMVVLFLRPKTSYQQGLPRMFWNRFDKLDFAWPSFARIGEQEVLQKELYFRGDDSADDQVFGYQQRYAEYKYIPSTVHGEFRTVQDHWHWGRIFNTDPSLSPEFVSCDPSDRIFNVLGATTDSLWVIVNNQITARRPLPYYGEPSL